MKYLLSFAIGAILGDIFFHLIPESVEGLDGTNGTAHKNVGLSVIAGIFMFVIVEMVLQRWSGESVENELENKLSLLNNDDEMMNHETVPHGLVPRSTKATRKVSPSRTDGKIYTKPEFTSENNNNNNNNDSAYENKYENNNNESPPPSPTPSNKLNNNDKTIPDSGSTTVKTTSLPIDPAGYLNLIANGFDNFTHGLAIGASFLVGPKVGLLTTFVIIIHEIPHEICDYAILVKSGFSRWDAVKAQSSVSLFGILGTATALYVKSIDTLNAKTSWILPFSAGGFLYIALVTLLPDILDKETKFQNSIGQIGCVILGIAFMGAVALF